MARDRKLEIAAINIVTHPHSIQGYVDLFYTALRIRSIVHLRGAHHGMIGEIWPITRGNPLDGLTGKFYRFIQIDPKALWFNVARHEAATEDEMARVRIPDDMKPDMAMFNFVFYPKGHTLYYEISTDTRTSRASLGPTSVKTLLETVFSDALIVKEFGEVDVTVVPEREQLEKIYALHRLAKLTIEITRPNPDDLEDEEQRVMERLNRQNAKKEKVTLTAVRHETIVPDEDTKTLARVASHNGKVTGEGADYLGKRLTISTTDHPWKDIIMYDPDSQLDIDALVARTRQLDYDGL